MGADEQAGWGAWTAPPLIEERREPQDPRETAMHRMRKQAAEAREGDLSIDELRQVGRALEAARVKLLGVRVKVKEIEREFGKVVRAVKGQKTMATRKRMTKREAAAVERENERAIVEELGRQGVPWTTFVRKTFCPGGRLDMHVEGRAAVWNCWRVDGGTGPVRSVVGEIEPFGVHINGMIGEPLAGALVDIAATKEVCSESFASVKYVERAQGGEWYLTTPGFAQRPA